LQKLSVIKKIKRKGAVVMFEIGQIVTAKEYGRKLEGKVVKVYDGSLDLCDVVCYDEFGMTPHEDCEVFFEQICA
jgi:hypothetical protein